MGLIPSRDIAGVCGQTLPVLATTGVTKPLSNPSEKIVTEVACATAG